MKMMIKLAAVAAIAFSAHSANAVTCIGTCGTLAPNGVVTAPPSGGPNYEYVSTSGGVNGAGQIASAGGTNGSELTTDLFTAAVGDPLNFFFNFVTSDGAGFSDYGFAQLLNSSNESVGFLFTARTVPSGNTSPGFGLPANISTLTPLTSPIIGGGPAWSALGSDSGRCFSSGCGYTGWIQSTYNITAAGSYKIRFGTTNSIDTIYQSGLAFSGITIKGEPVPTTTGAVPEPAAWMMMLLGMGAIGYSLRRKKPAVLAQLA